MATFQGHQKPITNAIFTKDGKKIISTSEDAVLRVWDPLTSKSIHKITAYNFHQQSIDCIAQHQTQPIVVTGGMDYFACLSNIQTGKVLGQTKLLEQPIFQVEFGVVQEQFYLGSSDGQMLLYDTSKLSLNQIFKLDGPITKLHPHLNYLIASTAQGFIYLIDPRINNPLQIHSCPSIIHDFTFDAINSNLYVATEDGFLRQFHFNL